jgi:virulence-associated protein VagC
MNARLPTSALPSSAFSQERESTVFKSGNSQAVRIPKEFQLNSKFVKIIQRNNELIIRPKYKTAAEILANLPPDDGQNPEEWDAFLQTIQDSRKNQRPERDLSHLFADEPPSPKASKTRASPASHAATKPLKRSVKKVKA